jgi:hypothetical protein
MLNSKDVSPTPPPPPKIGRLDSLKSVRLELAKVYREARGGTLKTEDAGRLTYILTCLAKLIEQSNLEARLTALERSLEVQQKFSTRNGVYHAN